MDDYVPYQLAQVSSRLSLALEVVYQRMYGLARTEWRTMALVGETTSCAAATLVERSGMDAVAVHRAVKRLESLGYLMRESVEHDKRVKALRLTPQGQVAYEAVVPYALALQRHVLATLSADESDGLKRALVKLMTMDFEPSFSVPPAAQPAEPVPPAVSKAVQRPAPKTRRAPSP